MTAAEKEPTPAPVVQIKDAPKSRKAAKEAQKASLTKLPARSKVAIRLYQVSKPGTERPADRSKAVEGSIKAAIPAHWKLSTHSIAPEGFTPPFKSEEFLIVDVTYAVPVENDQGIAEKLVFGMLVQDISGLTPSLIESKVAAMVETEQGLYQQAG